jgi:endo-1,4-beta-xylanase
MLMADVDEVKPIIANQFNQGIATFAQDGMLTGPDPLKLKAGWLDDQVNLAAESGITNIHFSHLFDNNVRPDWLASANYSREQAIQFMQAYVRLVMTRYQGKIKYWNVANEYYQSPDRPDDFFYHIVGPDYIELAFEMARAANPSAILIYNDTHNHSQNANNSNGDKTQLTLDIVKRLQKKGWIDAVGVQGHIDGANPPEKKDVTETLKRYGLPVMVTEFDVSLKFVKGDQRYITQAKIYRDFFEAALDSGVCQSFSFWGLGDHHSWLTEPDRKHRLASVDADPTLYDRNMQPKPAYNAILDVLKNRAK